MSPLTNTQGLIHSPAPWAHSCRHVTQNVPVRKAQFERCAAAPAMDWPDADSLAAFRTLIRASRVQTRGPFRLSDGNLKAVVAVKARVLSLHRRPAVTPLRPPDLASLNVSERPLDHAAFIAQVCRHVGNVPMPSRTMLRPRTDTRRTAAVRTMVSAHTPRRSAQPRLQTRVTR